MLTTGTGEEWKNVPTQGMAAYATSSLFQPHKARQAIRDAHEKKIPPILCYYAGLSSIPITRFLAPFGYDAIWIDWEHTSCDVETMTTMVHEAMFMSQGRTMPWVRVPGSDHAAIGYALDAGASIVVPQVETVEQAKHICSAAKFGPKSKRTRSGPPFRLVPGYTDTPFDPSRDIHTCLNDQAAIMIQIESELGVRNLDAILTECPEIDVVWMGTMDCRLSMGLAAQAGASVDKWGEPEWHEVKKLFDDTVRKHNKPNAGFAFVSGIMGSPERLRKGAEEFCFIASSGDVMHLMGMADDLKKAREVLAEDKPNHQWLKNGA